MSEVPYDAQDWSSLGERWRGQCVPGPDWTALQAEVARRSRRMAVTRALELGSATIAIVLCLVMALHADAGRGERIAAPFLLAIVVGFTGWTQVQRRRQWRAVGLAPPQLIAFELHRTRTSLRIWRASVWLSVALWGAMFAAAAVDTALHAPDAQALWVWKLNLVANAAVVLISALLAWGLGRRARGRLRRLQSLDAALRD